jgi:O-antigen ligase
MKLERGLLNYIKRPFVTLENEFLISFFWNCIILGSFLLPLGVNPSTPFFILAMLAGVFSLFTKKRNFNLSDLTFLSFPVLFVIMCISLNYSFNLDVGLKLLERFLPLFFLPIIFIFIKEDKLVVKKIFCALLTGIILSFLINIYHAFSSSLFYINEVLVFDQSLSGGHSFIESFSHGGSHFIGGEFSKLIPPSYLALYILVTLIFLFKNIISKPRIIIYGILFLYLFLLASRASFVILLILAALNLFTTQNNISKIKRLLILAAICSVFYGINPRAQIFFERVRDFTTKENYNYTTSEQSRILTYLSCKRLIYNAPIFGYGVGDANEELLIDYIQSDYLTNAKNKYNAHNQFFQTTLQVGVFGLVFLTIPFIVIVMRKKNVYVWAMLISLGGSLMFESMLIRYNGIMFFAILIPFLLRKERVVV